MEGLRLPFFVVAMVLAAAIVLIELGTGLATGIIATNPPGLGIPYMALVDGIMLFTLSLIAIGLVVPAVLVSRLQGCLTCLTSLILILGAMVLLILAVSQLFLMIGLIGSFFGALIYLAVWGSFPTAAAAAILGLLLVLKIGVAVFLVLAHQRFVQNKGLVLIVVTSLTVNTIVSILQAFPPSVLVSLTDTVAAIVVGAIGIIWAVVLLISAAVSIVNALRLPQVSPGETSR